MLEVDVEETTKWPTISQVREGIISAALEEVPLGVEENEEDDLLDKVEDKPVVVTFQDSYQSL